MHANELTCAMQLFCDPPPPLPTPPPIFINKHAHLLSHSQTKSFSKQGSALRPKIESNRWRYYVIGNIFPTHPPPLVNKKLPYRQGELRLRVVYILSMVIVGQGKRTHAQKFLRRSDAWGVPKLASMHVFCQNHPK